MAQFEIKKSENGEYYFRLKTSGSDKIVLRSELYKTKSGCENGIASVKNNAPVDSRYEKLHSANGKHYFNLKAANGEIIATSQLYDNSTGRDLGIEVVKLQVPGAPVTYLS